MENVYMMVLFLPLYLKFQVKILKEETRKDLCGEVDKAAKFIENWIVVGKIFLRGLYVQSNFESLKF